MSNLKINKLHESKTRLIRISLIALSLIVVSNVSVGGTKDCYTCNPEYVPGNPVEGNKTLGQLSQISLAMLSDKDSLFMGNLYGFCTEFFGGETGARTLRKRVLNEMEKNLVNGKVDSYFLEAGCSPEEIGNARSPIAHLAIELPTVRTEHLEVLRKYFIEKKKDGLFTKMLNAKNTIGQTSLDYVQYMIENGKYVQSQKPELGNFIKYLCSHGAKYSTYKNKSCNDIEVAIK